MKILNFYSEMRDGKKYVYVDIKLKNGEIKRRIPQFTNEKGRWFSFPSYSIVGVDGSRKFVPYWEFELPEHNIQFLEALNVAVKAYKIENNITDPEPLNLDCGELPF